MRFTIVAALSACLFLLTDGQGVAGAWTLKKHHWQTFNSMTLSVASQSYASNGRPSTPTKFQKFLVQNTVEYGLTDNVTLFATPAYVVASAQTGSTPETNARTSSVEAGARVLLFAHIGKLSLQSSYKAAGAFDLSELGKP